MKNAAISILLFKFVVHVLQRADIGLGSLTVMAERENVVDFTVPFYDLVGISILMKKPMIPTSLFKFLSVLEKEVWLCILSAYFLTRSMTRDYNHLHSYRGNLVIN